MKTWILAVTLLCGCSFALIRPNPRPATHTEPASCRSRAWAGLDLLGAAAVGLVALGTYAARCVDCEEPQRSEEESRTTLIAAATIVPLSSAIYGLLASDSCHASLGKLPAPPAPSDRGRAERRERLEQARVLHLEAVTDANSGNCAGVRERDPRIGELDAGYHANVFRRDAAIVQCLDGRSPRPDVPSVPSR